MLKRKIFAVSLVTALVSFSGTITNDPPEETVVVPPLFLSGPTPWADSVFHSLSLEERIGQLMMVAAFSNKNGKHQQEIETLVRDHKVGGLIFFQGGPHRQAKLTNRYQSIARTPLWLGMDLEWGLSMRLDSTIRFPRQMTLGAIQDEALIEEMGLEIARQMRRLGVHVSFSPVLDVNNNPLNPVINDRSFGEDRENVSRKGIAYMHGLQRGGVIATAKHFPGHGDTDLDSHYDLPVIAHDRGRLDSIELYPFRRLAREGLNAVMVAHLEIPALDSTTGAPSTFSRAIVNDLLKDEIGFEGLVFTDALNMKGVAKGNEAGEIELRALLAGNDVLLFPQDPLKAIERIKRAVAEGEIDREVIDRKCMKILQAKEWAGLSDRRPIELAGLHEDLNTKSGELLRRQLYASAITVLQDHHNTLPLRKLDSLRIASLVIGDSIGSPFQIGLQRYADVKTFRSDKSIHPDSLRALLRKLEGFDHVIVSVHNTSWRLNKDFGIPESALDIVREVALANNTILAHFANPYRLNKVFGAQEMDAVIVAYEETPDTQDLVAQLIFGAIGANGRSPVTATTYYAAGTGIEKAPIGRLIHTLPEAIGMRSLDLAPIDDIVREGIKAQAYPGAVVLVAVEGNVVFNKAYGHLTYQKDRKATADAIYDLASVTKVASTTLALMRLVDEGELDLDRPLGHYLPELEDRYTAHARMQLRDILTHQAGLRSFVPFYQRLVTNGKFKNGVVSDSSTAEHGIRVADRLYLRNEYKDSLLIWVLETPLGARGEYVYSDMGYYLLQEVIERISGMPLDRYLSSVFYAPMGASTLGYRPLERFSKSRIAPTEYDVIFRQRQVHGDVHDPGAAMKGGVAGHAGLFSNANDLAILMQMLLNKGTYAGDRYLSEEVIAEFTKCQFCKPDGSGNRRGLGFDRPVNGKGGPTCECVSYASFGHTGFTGTMAWADPENGSVYIFLSNRVYPNANKNLLAQLNIRTRIQEVVNDAVTARISATRVAAIDITDRRTR